MIREWEANPSIGGCRRGHRRQPLLRAGFFKKTAVQELESQEVCKWLRTSLGLLLS
jgi:hypothetical protein